MNDDGPRYALTDDGRRYCEDCGVEVIVAAVHTRFHSILSGHAWALAILRNSHLSAQSHDRYDVVERMNRRRFDSWTDEAFTEVTGTKAQGGGGVSE